MDTLLNFSGGIDSTYVAWKWLKENHKKKLLIHHVDLGSPEGIRRRICEKKACEKILKYFKANGLNNFKYIESTVDYTKFRHTIKDAFIHFYMAGVLLELKPYHNIDKLIVPYNKNDWNNNHKIPFDDIENNKRWKIFNSIVDRDIDIQFPIRDMLKIEMMAEMPEELLNATWYCRRPTIKYKPCKKCVTCLEVSEYRRGV